MKTSLYEKLLEHGNSDEYAFHMPGHKRNETMSPFADMMKLDITEIEDFDNLHHAEGIIKQEQEFVAHLYGAKNTFYLVNGSTCGILSAIGAVTKDGDPIVFSRNSHKSAYHALYLKNLQASYLYPQLSDERSDISGKIDPEDVAAQMDESGAKVVFITSPTYEGIVSDVERIAECVHEREGILIVDEAHGAHFGFHSYFPESAVKKGADLVVQSMHKTLPSLTQTALLHVCSDRADINRIRMQLSMFQTSSPSYLLMASMSRCLHLMEEKKEILFSEYAVKLEDFYKKAEKLKNLSVISRSFVKQAYEAEFDPSKINICTNQVTDQNGKPYKGKELAKDLLCQYHLQMEMVSENYVIAMTSLYDTQEGFDRLLQALFEIDRKLTKADDLENQTEYVHNIQPLLSVISVKNAMDGAKKRVRWEECVDSISAEFVFLYPPGSPILVPGEKITWDVWNKIQNYKEQGLSVQGMQDYALKEIYIAINP